MKLLLHIECLGDRTVKRRGRPADRRRLSRPRFDAWPLQVLALLFLNLALAPAVAAATGADLPQKSVYALTLLGLVVLGLLIYLFLVIFQPERF